MKKLTALLLALIFALTLCNISFSAETTTSNITVTVDNSHPAVGETFTYTVNISDPGVNIGGVQMRIYYDKTKLEVSEVSNGGMFTSEEMSNTATGISDNPAQGYVSAIANSLSGKRSGTFASVTFTVKDGATGDFTPRIVMPVGKLIDTSSENIPFEIDTDNLHVGISSYDITMSCPEVTTTLSTVTYTATFANITETMGIYSANFNISYPADNLTYVSSSLSTKPSATWTIDSQNNVSDSEGNIYVMVSEDSDGNGSYTAATNDEKLEVSFTFTVKDDLTNGTQISVASSESIGTSGADYNVICGNGSSCNMTVVTDMTLKEDNTDFAIDDFFNSLDAWKNIKQSDIIAAFNENVTVYNGEIEITDPNAVIGTGFTVKLIIAGNQVGSALTVCIMGDVDGGGITSSDYVRIKGLILHRPEAPALNDIYLKAADINGNGALDSNDYFLIKIYILNKISSLKQ